MIAKLRGVAPSNEVEVEKKPRAATTRSGRAERRKKHAFASLPRSAEQTLLLADYLRARQGFATDAELATVLGIHPSQISRWKSGEFPSTENAALLRQLAVVTEELVQFLDPEVVADWLTTPQFELANRTPMQALRESRLADVLLAANATEYGAYI